MSDNLPPQLNLPPEAQWGPGFDVARATDAYIATIPAADRAKSDAYFEGGYWTDAWAVLIAVAISWILLQTRFSAKLRDFAERRTARPYWQGFIYAALIIVVMALLTLPWTLYTGYFREHQYGLSNQDLGDFFGDQAKSLGLLVLAGSFAIAGFYRIVRRVRERWVYWATGITAVFMLFFIMIYPVFVAPIFNDYHSLPDGELRQSIVTLAKKSGIPATDISWFDASRQTTRISANVSGLFGTTRIALNDNLLNGTTEPEIRAAMAHEMGHYVLRHPLWLTLALALVYGIAYWVVNRVFGRFQRRNGERWGVRDLADPAGFPLALAIFAVVMYLLTPVTNSIVRTAENQADAFGLDAAREPYGFASVSMRLSVYRKLEPGRLEEIIFYDHPSGRDRVERAMRWLADHPPVSP
jgi:Zn-dependent protease with chaperone function